MCMQFLPGRQQDLQTVSLTEIEQLASLVARVHECPIDGLGASMGRTTTVAACADDRLRAILSTLEWARDPLPKTLQDRLRRAADSVAESFEASGAPTVSTPARPSRYCTGTSARETCSGTPAPA